MTPRNPDLLEAVFGPGSYGDTPEERARTSTRVFVRSLDQLANEKPGATGRRLTAAEALDAYGWDLLLEVAHEGAALLPASGRPLSARRYQLGLGTEVGIRAVALQAGVAESIVAQAEASRRVRIQDYERIARTLGLDERQATPSGNERLATRLRSVGEEKPRMTAAVVSALAEAAWVAMTQVRLERALGLLPTAHGLEPSSQYGQPGYPAYRHGYYLAGAARKKLNLGDGPLPKPLRELGERSLGIPIIQTSLGDHVGGATIELGDKRAIVLSVDGDNSKVLVRRSTLAHELGHLLFDPANRLSDLRVDDYAELSRRADTIPDPVEQRANAFSVEFIAPQKAVVDVFRSASDNPVFRVMDHFGISLTAARYQIWNGLDRRIPFDDLQVEGRPELDPAWEAGESFTLDFHPLGRMRTSRAGRFSAVVTRAAQERLVAWDTAAEWLETSIENVQANAATVCELFGI